MSTLHGIETKEQAKSLLKTLKSKIHEIFGENIEENSKEEGTAGFYAQKMIEIQEGSNKRSSQSKNACINKKSKVVSYRNTKTIDEI